MIVSYSDQNFVLPAWPAGAPVQAALDASLLVAVEEEDEEDARLVPHLAAPGRQVVVVAREPVDEEVLAACRGAVQ